MLRVAAASTVLMVVIASCGGEPEVADDRPPVSDSPSSARPSPTKDVRDGTEITTRSSEFGTILFGRDRQAIYMWQLEKSEKPRCYGGCAEAWPPVLTDGEPRVAGDVDEDLLGTARRKDGSTQVTYAGHPLYYYAHEGPGEVKCHNVATHGGLWWVVQPDGTRAP